MFGQLGTNRKGEAFLVGVWCIPVHFIASSAVKLVNHPGVFWRQSALQGHVFCNFERARIVSTVTCNFIQFHI